MFSDFIGVHSWLRNNSYLVVGTEDNYDNKDENTFCQTFNFYVDEISVPVKIKYYYGDHNEFITSLLDIADKYTKDQKND